MSSAVITPDTKDTPSLTVTINRLSPSSPFPSPGSPFLPPPIPSAHEYALISPASKRRSTDSRMNVGSKTGHESVASTNAAAATTETEAAATAGKGRGSADVASSGTDNSNGVASFAVAAPGPGPKSTVDDQVTTTLKAKLPNGTVVETPVVDGPPPERDALGVNSSELSTLNGGPVSTPASPSTPLASSQNPPAADECSTSTTTTTTTTITATTTATAQADTAKSSLDNLRSSRNSLHSSRDSLTSTRPAPPSPATSRRTSAALSRHSSTRSRPGSIAPTTPVDPQDAEVTSPTTPTPTQQQARKASTPPAATAQAILVKIRDFAFPDEDVRHTGTGPLTPRPNRRLQRPLSTWSASSASSAGSSDHDDGAGAGGSSYGFAGWGLGRLSWFGARSTGGPSGDGPSEGDFARNFTDAVSPENEIDDPYESLDDDDDDDDGGGVHRGDRADDYEQDGERPLLPGLYRALYTFEPEGTAEMALEEDQIVRVIGRGGGVGWAIVARGGEEGHALVPEGYLELVSLDRDQVGEEEG